MATMIDPEQARGKAPRSAGETGGGNVSDLLRRMSVIESLVAETRADVSAIKAVLPHLATKADLGSMEAKMETRICSVETKIYSMETKIIRWLVGTALGTTSLAFAVAKFVN